MSGPAGKISNNMLADGNMKCCMGFQPGVLVGQSVQLSNTMVSKRVPEILGTVGRCHHLYEAYQQMEA